MPTKQETEQLKRNESHARQRAAASLAAEGKYTCRFCYKAKELHEGIVITWGGNVMFAFCPACFPDRKILMEQRVDSQGRPCVYVGYLKDTERPPDILVASNLQQAKSLVPKQALSQFKKTEL